MRASFLDSYLLKQKEKTFLRLKKDFPDTVSFIRLSKALIRYTIIGNGSKTIVFIPDAPNTIEHYKSLSTLLSHDYRIIIFELPGFGFSIPLDSSFAFTLQEGVDVTIEFLERMQIEKCNLCFSCVSGYIALKVAELKPQLVERIIAIQTPSWEEEIKWSKRVDFKGIMATPYLGQIVLALGKNVIAKRWYENALPKNSFHSLFFQTCQHALGRGACFCLASAFQGFFIHSYPVFKRIEQPTLLIWGTKDRSHRKTNKESAKKYFKSLDIILFENSGHFPELEETEKFFAVLKNFS